ncbi:hypothetical protein MRB53_023899 [Persea americana]|uniref:Uncharacterized protein n=1 Tax=Persea americana TaxID=3435 RepID=A0ACC2LBJ7_PERAE|nr:hypothetical protein MRB53_023899 [Persea americana]
MDQTKHGPAAASSAQIRSVLCIPPLLPAACRPRPSTESDPRPAHSSKNPSQKLTRPDLRILSFPLSSMRRTDLKLPLNPLDKTKTRPLLFTRLCRDLPRRDRSKQIGEVFDSLVPLVDGACKVTARRTVSSLALTCQSLKGDGEKVLRNGTA